MVSCTASCAVTPSVMASSLSKVSPAQAQHLLHHVAQFKALQMRLSQHSWSPQLVRCSSDTGECAVVHITELHWVAAIEFACLQLHINQVRERQSTGPWSSRQLEE